MLMNKKLLIEVNTLPSYVVDMFANECGVLWATPAELLELQSIILEEIVNNDVNSSNIFLAFKEVKESVAERLMKWRKEHFCDALNV